MSDNELAEFYMHLETKNADLRALVGELVEGLEKCSEQLLFDNCQEIEFRRDIDALIAKAKDEGK